MNFRFRQGGILITIIINTECYFTVYSDIFSILTVAAQRGRY